MTTANHKNESDTTNLSARSMFLIEYLTNAF